MSDGEHYSTYGPICPHCGYEHSPDEPHYFDEDVCELRCHRCNEDFASSLHVSHSWTTSPLPDPIEAEAESAVGMEQQP